MCIISLDSSQDSRPNSIWLKGKNSHCSWHQTSWWGHLNMRWQKEKFSLINFKKQKQKNMSLFLLTFANSWPGDKQVGLENHFLWRRSQHSHASQLPQLVRQRGATLWTQPFALSFVPNTDQTGKAGSLKELLTSIVEILEPWAWCRKHKKAIPNDEEGATEDRRFQAIL